MVLSRRVCEGFEIRISRDYVIRTRSNGTFDKWPILFRPCCDRPFPTKLASSLELALTLQVAHGIPQDLSGDSEPLDFQLILFGNPLADGEPEQISTAC